MERDPETTLLPRTQLSEGNRRRTARWLGRTIEGRYEILDLLGQGGMGVVYRARDLRIGADVAIKIVDVDGRPGASAIHRLEREARAVALIGHENIVTVLDFGRIDEGSAFLAMQLLRGETLEQALLGRGPFSLAAACHVTLQAAYALEAAHERGVIHRDVKPGNIFLAQEHQRTNVVKVLDFGIAALQMPLAGQEKKDRALSGRAIVGTAEYMAPERFTAGVTIDQRADVYALGATLYEILSGAPPFRGDTPVETVLQALEGRARPLSEVVADLPLATRVDALMQELLARDPSDRLPTMRLLRERLVALRRELREPTRRRADSTRDVRSSRRPLCCWVGTSEGVTTVELAGVVDERAELEGIGDRIVGPEVLLRVAEIEHFNSGGFRRWSDWLWNLVVRGLTVTLHECSPAVIRQANLSEEFLAGSQVASFQARFWCTRCGLRRSCVLRTQDVVAGTLHTSTCDVCGTPLTLDEVEETFFRFLAPARRSVVPRPSRPALVEEDTQEVDAEGPTDVDRVPTVT